jgi:hypothetical protein
MILKHRQEYEKRENGSKDSDNDEDEVKTL